MKLISKLLGGHHKGEEKEKDLKQPYPEQLSRE